MAELRWRVEVPRAMGTDSATDCIGLAGVGAVPMIKVVILGVHLLFLGVVNDHGARAGGLAGVSVGGEGAGPGDVAMAGRVEGVAAFGEDPAGAGVGFAESEEIGGDVLIGAGEAFFGDRELVHEGEAEVGFFGGKIDFKEAAAEAGGGFPTDLATEARFVASGLDGGQVLQEAREDGGEEVPVFGAGGEEGAEPEGGVFGLVEVEGGEVALAGGSDVESQTDLSAGAAFAGLRRGKEGGEGIEDELTDLALAGRFGGGIELAEELEDLAGFEVNALDLVVIAAAFDGGPLDDRGGGGAERVAHVRLLVNFFGAGTGLAIGDELFRGEARAFGAVDDIEEAEFDGVGHGDLEIEIPGSGGIFDFWFLIFDWGDGGGRRGGL